MTCGTPIKMCNEAAIIKIVLPWNESWQTSEAALMSTNIYIYIYESALKVANEVVYMVNR